MIERANMEDWDEIHGFQSPDEYARFLKWISEAIADGVLQPVSVASRYAAATVFEERWCRSTSGQVWRPVAPDFPFRGVFEKVDAGTERVTEER